MGVSENGGTFLGGSYNKDYTILGDSYSLTTSNSSLWVCLGPSLPQKSGPWSLRGLHTSPSNASDVYPTRELPVCSPVPQTLNPKPYKP